MSGGSEEKLGRSLAPLLFAALVACLLAAYVSSAHGQALLTIASASAAALAAAGICLEVLRVDARLAAAETAAAAPPLGESVHSFARSGRSALLVFVRLDRGGRLVDATAFDPDHYS